MKNKRSISFILSIFMMLNLISFNVFATEKVAVKEILSSIDVCVQAGTEDADKPPTQIGGYQPETLRIKYVSGLDKYYRKVLLMFDTLSLALDEIAEGDQVQIKLQLTKLENNAINPNKDFIAGDVYSIPSTWAEDTITWKTIPQDGRTKITSFSKRNIKDSILTIDVTEAVKSAKASGENKVSFELNTPYKANENMIVFHSSRATTQGVLKPTLALTKAADIEADKEIYETLRTKWYNRLTGNDAVDKEDAQYKKLMLDTAENAQKVWDTMEKGADRTALWTTLNGTTKSADVTSLFKNLEAMAFAYASSGCDLYQNGTLKQDILDGLDWMYKNRYNETVKFYNNWWDWDIGAPQPLCNILILMYKDLSVEQLNNQLNTLNRFNPNPYYTPLHGPAMTGANLLDTSLVTALKGIIGEYSDPFVEVKDAISDVLPYAIKGDGFYKDGSFVYHDNLAYNGGYGSVLLGALDKLLFIFDKTQWQVTDPQIENVYDWVTNAFEPLYYNGAIMDMTSGRGVSRYKSNDHSKGRATLKAILLLADSAPMVELQNQIKSFVKENIIKNQVYKDNYYEGMDMPNILAIKKLLVDESIQPRGALNLHKVYGSMDKVVDHRDNFSLGISMYSSRMGSFEIGNGENKRGYHTGDGMLYLYNDDYKQFSEAYWPTIDAMRLPGITTDGTNGYIGSSFGPYTNTKDWVGGSSINDLYGATGMDFEMQISPVKAKKSWFSFDDEIVCLGTGITSTDGKMVETIVENRKIKDTNDNTLIINGQNKVASSGAKEFIEKAKWAVLSGNTDAGTDSIGYYFPEASTITALRDTRTGSWKEINDDGIDTPITKNYISMAIEHGANPIDSTYSYALLPGKDTTQMEQYSNNPDISVLSNTTDIQAVRENKLDVIGFNFWKPLSTAGVTSKNEASVMIELNEDTIQVAVSDPTQKGTNVELEIAVPVTSVVSKDNSVTAEISSGTIKLNVDVTGSAGQSHKIILARDTTAKTGIVDVETPNIITVDNGTEFNKIPFPTKLISATSDVNNCDVNVSWEKGNYDATKDGIYEITGILTPPAGIQNTNGIQAKIKVIVGSPEITSIINPDPVRVIEGVEFDKAKLPTKVVVKTNDEKIYDVNVKWNKGNYNKDVVGTYEIIGTLQLSDELLNPKGLFPVMMLQVGNSSIIATDDTYVQGGTDADKAGGAGYNPAYSKTIIATRTTVKSDPNRTRKALVKFNIENIPADADKIFVELETEKIETDFSDCEVYTIKPDWTSATATFNKVEALDKTLVTSFTKEDIKESKLKLDVTEAVKKAISENQTDISFKFSIPTEANNNYITFYSLEGTKSKPTLSWTKDIVGGNVEISEVNAFESKIVPYGTTKDKLELAKSVNVKLSNGETTELPINWVLDNYNANISGEYTLEGNLILSTGILNTEQYKANITIFVSKFEQVIADAQAILENPNATAEEIVKAMSDIANAMTSFENQNN